MKIFLKNPHAIALFRMGRISIIQLAKLKKFAAVIPNNHRHVRYSLDQGWQQTVNHPCFLSRHFDWQQDSRKTWYSPDGSSKGIPLLYSLTRYLMMTGLARFVPFALVIQLLGAVLVLFGLQAIARSTSLKALACYLPSVACAF